MKRQLLKIVALGLTTAVGGYALSAGTPAVFAAPDTAPAKPQTPPPAAPPAKGPATPPATGPATAPPGGFGAAGPGGGAGVLGASQAAGPVDIKCEPDPLDLGKISTGNSGKGTVKLTNIGGVARTLLDCKSSCGCTTPQCPKGTILQPGESIDIEIKMDAGEKARSLAKTVTFMFSDSPPVRLTVKSEAVAFVAATPDTLDPTIHADGRIVFRATDDQPFKITSMYPPLIENFPDEAKVEHVVTIDWEQFGTAGFRQRKLMFRMDHPQCNRVTVMLSAAALRLSGAASGVDVPTPPEGATATPAPAAAPAIPELDRLLKEGKTADAIAMIESGKIGIDEADKSGQSPLIKGARWGNAEFIQHLLDHSASLAATDKMGRNALMYACQSKSLEAVRVLLDAGSDVNQADQIGNTPVCWAAGFGTKEIVEELVNAGGRVEVAGGMIGFTPLIWAAGFGERATVEFLVAHKANVNARDVLQGATPLMHAARTGRMDNMEALIKAGAEMEAKDKDGSTPLLVAARNSGADSKVVQMLVDAGADLTARDNTGKSVLELAATRTDPRGAEVVTALSKILADKGITLTATPVAPAPAPAAAAPAPAAAAPVGGATHPPAAPAKKEGGQ